MRAVHVLHFEINSYPETQVCQNLAFCAPERKSSKPSVIVRFEVCLNVWFYLVCIVHHVHRNELNFPLAGFYVVLHKEVVLQVWVTTLFFVASYLRVLGKLVCFSIHLSTLKVVLLRCPLGEAVLGPPVKVLRIDTSVKFYLLSGLHRAQKCAQRKPRR